MKKVLMVIPPDPEVKDVKQTGSKWPRVGLAYIASYLRENGVWVEVLDCRAEDATSKEIEDRITQFEPDVLAVSSFTEEIIESSMICNIAKRVDSSILTVVGGPHASAIPERTLEEFKHIDVAVYGEGEETMLKIVENESSMDLYQVQGIVHRNNGQIIRNEPRKLIDDIDLLPYPAWDLFPLSKYRGITSTNIREKKGVVLELPILSARGCPYNCNFCYRPYGRAVRFRDPTKVVDEIEYAVNQYGATQFLFVEGTFGMDKQKSLAMCNQIIGRGLHEKIKWIAETRADVVSEELLSMMKQAGCVLVGFGVESGNTQILKKSGKGITHSQVRESISLIKKIGIPFECYFIMGHPNETKSTIQESLDFVKALDPDLFNAGIMIPYPGTKIWDMARKGEGNYRLLTENWSEYSKQRGGPLELNNISLNELRKIQSRAYLQYYLRPKKLSYLLRSISIAKLTKISLDLMRNILRRP